MRERLAYTAYEQGRIVRELLSRFTRPPSTDQHGNDARLLHHRTLDQTTALILARPELVADLVRHYDTALATRPDDWVLRRNAGMAFTALGHAATGKPLLEQAVAEIPVAPDTLSALAQAHRALGETAPANEVFARLRALEPRYPGLPAAE